MEVIKNEYISKLKVVQILQKAYAEGRIQAKDGCTSVLDDINAADVQPVKRGKWVYYKNNGIWDIHKCTVCNTPFELPMDVVPSSVFCYCPHCGADMCEPIKG